MKKLGISFKLYLSFGALVLLMLAMSAVAWRDMAASQRSHADYADQVRAGVYLSNAERAMWELRFGVAQFMLLDERARERILAEGPKRQKDIVENIGAYAEGNRSADEKGALVQWEEVFSKYIQARSRWFELYQAGKKDEAAEYRAQYTNVHGAASVKSLSRLIELQKGIGDTREHNTILEGRETKRMMTGFIATTLILGVLLSVFISRKITVALNHSTGLLSETVAQVTSASKEVAAASQSLAEGSSEQAAALEETSSSLEQMTSMTKQNADSTAQANALILDARKVVELANELMTKLTRAMEEISGASGQTAKIIKTIDEIAFQTNLLALNAAVEAARAGEAGAGFAVVADEVRSLALRAAQAAKDTASLIETTITKVKEGSGLVNGTAEAFTQVTGSITGIKDLLAEIAAASSEQAQGLSQINKAVAEMDKVVQHNAASAEESAGASVELNAQAERMSCLLGGLLALTRGGSEDARDFQLAEALH